MNKLWIIGAGSPVGQAIRKDLRTHFSVVSFIRGKPSNILEKNDIEIVIDLCNTSASKQIFRDIWLRTGGPDCVVFCQRYRPSNGEIENFTNFKIAADVELSPLYILRDLAKEIDLKRPISFVAISSVVAKSINLDVPVNYHLIKNLICTAVQLFATLDAKSGIRWNTVLLGEFLKFPKEKYTFKQQKKFDAVGSFSLSRRLCDLNDICRIINFLATKESEYVTGNEFFMNGSLRNIGAEYFLREFAKNNDQND